MPRPSKGPRLYAQPGRSDSKPVWVIRDGSTKISTGISVGDSRKPPQEAIEALGQYIVSRHAPGRSRNRDAASCSIADVISIYLRDKAENQARPSEVAGRAKKLLEFWGEKTLDQVTGSSCREYIKFRDGSHVARRELEDLRAAINYHRKEGLCREVVEVTLPEKGQPRAEWIMRDEAARLIWSAWRYREPVSPFRKSRQHVARFILVALYTGTRSGAVCSSALMPTIGRGWIDLDGGVFHRSFDGERETKKRKPPVRLPERLLSHIRRWYKNGQRFAVEFNGAPVKDVDKAFRNTARECGLERVTPHVLRHTAATWLMQAGIDKWESSGFLGMTVETLERIYGHHHPDFQSNAAEGITSKRK